MRFIDTNDLELWANSVDCKYHLPHLIRKLILETTDNSTIKNMHFPYGEDVQTGGYDGELTTESENMFVPLGESIWEFGTTNNKKGKADEDYEKRKADPLGKIPDQTTYINVNAKRYRDKNKWAAEKKEEGFYRDVRYLDAIDIEQWLELAPATELWLAEKLKKPTSGIYTAAAYWQQWSESKTLKIVPELLLGKSRSQEIEAVTSFLTNDKGVLYIKSITTDEAEAFPLAVIKLSDGVAERNIVVIDNREAFNRFIQTDKPLLILAKFKPEGNDIRGAVQKGHKILLPLSLADEVTATEKIQLPIVDAETFEHGLTLMGIDPEQTRILSKSSGRNISVLKRLLKFDEVTKPKYLDHITIREMIPMLLVNRFSEDRGGDREIIEILSGKTYAEYAQFLKILATLDDSPVYYINGVWRLVSPTDAWLFFAKYLTREDLDEFQKVSTVVLSEVLYKYTFPLEERGSYYQTPENRTKYSTKVREGLCESLVAISVFGQDYGLGAVSNVSHYIDAIVLNILSMDIVVWRSLSGNLKLLAEASPTAFLSSLERIINDRSVTAFFEVQEGLLDKSNDLAPLLWCLDIIAWFPEHLMRVSMALCEIIAISPDNFPTANTPMSNLKSIFRTWYPQTNTNAEDRKRILEILIKKYPDTLYSLLFSLVGTKHDTAFHTPRPKWRLFSELREIMVTQGEVYYMRGFCTDHIIEMSKGRVDRILSLIDLLDDMDWNRIDTALNAITTSMSAEEKDRSPVFHKFRKFIGNHRSYPDAHWSLPAEILDKIEVAANSFKTDGDILEDRYLFEGGHPEFIEGRKGRDYKKHGEELLSRRLTFVEAIVKQYGIAKIFELAASVEHPYVYGHILALSDTISPQDTMSIYRLIESESSSDQAVAREFIRISENRTDLSAQIDILNPMMHQGISQNGIVQFLVSLRGSIDLWKFIDGINDKDVALLYWKSQQRFLYTETKEELFYAIDKLGHYNKPITQLNTLGWGAYVHKEHLTSDEVLTALENVSFENFDDSSQFDHHNFTNLLEFLYHRDDYDMERGAKIEMKFLFVFGGGLYNPKPKNLYKLMSLKPEEYFGVVSQIYLPDDEKLKAAALKKIEENLSYQESAKAAYGILDSFNVLPSLQQDGSMDPEVLKKWVEDVRELAAENFRVRVTEDCIGKLLAKYPVDMAKGTGYPEAIYDIIEAGSETLKLSFRIQISNNLGFTSRAAFEGGGIERGNAHYFNSLFEETKYTHPQVALLFKDLSDKYSSEAKWEDENALLRSLE